MEVKYNAFKAALVVSLVCGVAACGGGSSKDNSGSVVVPEPVATSLLNGKVIDGYVSGATVWLDINGNGVLNEDEPSTVSTQAGDYALELTAAQRECVPYAALYVDVPVGAVDEDSGEVTEAYQMARPAQFQPLDEAALLHISPLTSVLWQQVRALRRVVPEA